MLGSSRTRTVDLAAVERVQHWTRARFALADDVPVMAAQVSCNLPGCPPLETVVAFWADGRRHHFKVFKPLADVNEDDLPYAWQREALAAADGLECECC